MARFGGPVSIALLCFGLLAQVPLATGADLTTTDPAVAIELAEVRTTEQTLQIRYQIRNGAANDIWICESMNAYHAWGFEAYPSKDGETLVIQRGLDTPKGISREQPIGHYVRLRSGETRAEGMSFHLPVRLSRVLPRARREAPLKPLQRLVLEIGYYEGDLPATIFGTLEKVEGTVVEEPATVPAYHTSFAGQLGGSLMFNELNEGMRARDEEVLLPRADQGLEGEKVLQMTVDDLEIPYSGEYVRPTPIHLSPCKRIEISFTRSPLDFFFPLPQEQSLLSLGEKQYLQSLKGFLVEDRWDLMGIAYDASEAIDGAFFTTRGVADLTCHRKDGSIVPLVVYDSRYIVTPEGQVFTCFNGFTRLRSLSRQVQAFDQRIQCAANLKNLWCRFRLYYMRRHLPKSDEEFRATYFQHGCTVPLGVLQASARVYPAASEWCDALGVKECACPSAGKGKCHYALNPDCLYDSPADMVLLFETKAGWNQHGGPKLFAFGNHDPRGGLVLLNDGTVKFIRTEEELNQLRWR